MFQYIRQEKYVKLYIGFVECSKINRELENIWITVYGLNGEFVVDEIFKGNS